MAINYRIYANDYAGGPVDYGTVVASTASLTYEPAAIPTGSDVTFAVRAYDTVTGLEERNVAATFRIVTDGAGLDVTAIPRKPPWAWAIPEGGETISVGWRAAFGGPTPVDYAVYGGTPSISWTTPLDAEAHVSGQPHYKVSIAGLTAGSTYEFAVVARNAAGDSAASAVVRAVPYASSGLGAPESLSGVAGWVSPG